MPRWTPVSYTHLDVYKRQDLCWRLSATVPVGLTAYDTYAVQFVDTMSAGLDSSKVAAKMCIRDRVEITPKNIRLRKRPLNATDRKKAAVRAGQVNK